LKPPPPCALKRKAGPPARTKWRPANDRHRRSNPRPLLSPPRN
jgi:hypothetical protein